MKWKVEDSLVIPNNARFGMPIRRMPIRGDLVFIRLNGPSTGYLVSLECMASCFLLPANEEYAKEDK